MKKNYLKYYDTPSSLAPVRFFWDLLFLRRPVARIALKNRSKDYFELTKRPELFPLHRHLNQILYEAVSQGDGYDYGEGYFYQSMAAINITGLRNTEKRIEAMHLQEFVSQKNVLEIGCNSGFLSLSIAPWAKSITGFDIMPYLSKIARTVAAYLNITNARFLTSAFEDYAEGLTYDVVLSFANHATFDGQTRQKLEAYFEKCARYCCEGGMLIFESHPPAFEGTALKKAISLIEERFLIIDQKVLNYGTFLDTGRTYIVSRKKPT